MKQDLLSPNFDDRVGGPPDMIVLHYTGMRSGAEALARLCDPAAKVSAHYVIAEDGTCHALVPEDKRAWHAGVSYWQGETDINSRAIGIELVNGGHEFGYTPFPAAQIAALIALCHEIIARYGIKPARILGHSDVAPARKIDPGHVFPWRRLAEEGVGVFPFCHSEQREESQDTKRDPSAVPQDDRMAFHAALLAYGYDPKAQPEDVIVAFHRHFCPERFRAWCDKPDAPDDLSWLRLARLTSW